MSVSKQHSSAASRKSGNNQTPSKKNSAGQELAEAQTRADRLLMELDQCATRKLRELKDELLVVRNDFNTLKKGQKISRCQNWDEFCTKKLHRTKRAVNLLLADKPMREETSHPEPAVVPNDAESDAGLSAEDESNIDPELQVARQRASGVDIDGRSLQEIEAAAWDLPEPRKRKLKELVNGKPAIPYSEDLDAARKKLRYVFEAAKADEEEIGRKLADLLNGMTPFRTFSVKVTIEEVPKPKAYHYELFDNPKSPTGVTPVRVKNNRLDGYTEDSMLRQCMDQEEVPY